ncbi:kinase-like domain-containing protein [Ochromonadaceae sp. CCMP2298]|nr:kinase-like domain-containing protein [Ochromonadaceae sp. CCMP2298]
MFGYPSEDVWPGWDLRAFILKSNDDLRQEVSCLQVMQIFKEVFEHFGLQEQLFLRPYRIFSTGNSTGLVQVLEDAMSLDALKKTAGFTTLDAYFRRTYDSSAERLNAAKTNFASSLAAYSLFSYLLLVKDRHNGNLMIDSEGHIIHIDFGFLLSIAPGGAFSLETAPFKLTEEMVEVLGGLDSALFGEFLTAFTKGFIALQSNAENIIQALQVLSRNSSFPCFQGKQASVIIDKLRGRFRTELGVNDAVKHCLDLITNSYGHYGTRQYDTFQWITNGIMP